MAQEQKSLPFDERREPMSKKKFKKKGLKGSSHYSAQFG